MQRLLVGGLVLGIVLAGAARGQDGDKVTKLKVDDLSPSLLSKLVGRYLARDFKDTKDKDRAATVEKLQRLGGLDKIADNLNYQVVNGKPRFIYVAPIAKPADSEELVEALQQVLDHALTQLASKPEQVGEEKFGIDKAQADQVRAEFPDSIRILWKQAPKSDQVTDNKPTKSTENKAKSAKASEGSTTLPPPTQQSPSSARSGKWVLLPAGYVRNCCGQVVPVYRWSYQQVNGNGNGNGNGHAHSNGNGNGVKNGTMVRSTSYSIRRDENGVFSVKGMKPSDAPKLFWKGFKIYWERDYPEAWEYFDAATRLSNDDARYWYFKALCELELGRDDEAIKSRRRGAELQASVKPTFDTIGRTLERVQGRRRAWLREGIDSLPN